MKRDNEVPFSDFCVFEKEKQVFLCLIMRRIEKPIDSILLLRVDQVELILG